ncbi:hypothetical protein OAF54_02720, partial [bacterium]|nr:hypothetical protein [bacterium]
MAALEAELIARFDQAQREIKQTVGLVDGLEGELNQMSVAATKAGTSLQRVNRRAGNSSQIFFQAGQAVSDFAVAGVLGAANNIEFLALQMGASGPLIGAITALSVTALVFRDDIDDAFDSLFGNMDKVQAKAKEVGDELINIKKGIKITFEGTADELEADSNRIGEIIDRLTARSSALSGAIGAAQTGVSTGFITFNALADTEQLEEELKIVNALLARQKGIHESITASVEEQRLLTTILADLEGTGLTKNIEEVKKKKEALTLVEKAINTNKKLKEQLEAAKNDETSRLEIITQQNLALKDQLKIQRELNKTRRALSATGAPDRPAVPIFSRDKESLGFQFSDTEGLDAATAELVISGGLDLGEKIEVEMIDPMKEAKERADELA